MSSPRGLYDLVITESGARILDALEDGELDAQDLRGEEVSERLVDVLSLQLRRILEELGAGESDRATTQLALVNELLREARSRAEAVEPIDPIAAPPRILRGIREPGRRSSAFPETGLAAPWLFTAGHGSPALLDELRREAADCDRIDILVSFITMSGVRRIIDILRSITAADAHGIGRTRIRVLTTTYTGATEVQALDQLARLNGCEVKVSLDGRRTRLHAKAWIFQRKTGFGSAYVGSANLSHSALMGGLEWTVKFTQRGQGVLFDNAQAHFETLWADDEFRTYSPDDAESRRALIDALRRESGEPSAELEAAHTFFDIQPKHFQKEMLEQLAHEREHGRHRNLVVAATGTGKTVVAALDYRNICAQLGHRPRLLFVAHRAQILRQARRTYQEVLRDHSFGELLTGGATPASYDHLFASIDSLSSRELVANLGPSYWHTVVIDECHRLAANRFDQLATTIQPQELLGLTATPERTDGQSILKYFSQRADASPAVELRLWDALDMQLLSPFEYYGCDDETDFSEIPWDKVGEIAAIDKLVTGNVARARLVVNEWRRLTADPLRSKALVFCVSVDHARFMTDHLNKAGLPAMRVVGETPDRERLKAPRRLAEGEVCALVTVDLYNEGVDLPDVDTLLLLRPTQSPVLFQQQIGRGLRLSPGKESCLILDFVGQHRADFRFDRLLSTITGLTRRELIEAVDKGFGNLPPACHIHLNPRTREQVLRSLRSLTQQSWRRLAVEAGAYAALRGRSDIGPSDFLHDQHIALDEVYRESRPSGWTTLRRHAGLLPGDGSEDEADLSRRFGWLTHLDDTALLTVARRVAEKRTNYRTDDQQDTLRLRMLAHQVDLNGTSAKLIEELNTHEHCTEELRELAELLVASSRLLDRPIPGFEDIPLALHGSYQIREILTAVGYRTDDRRTPFQAGVLGLPERKVELLFVTLDKSAGFHDRIAYHDYAVSPSRFHWQTQNSAGPDTTSGRRYIESQSNGWTFQLFVRSTKAHPYRACGPVSVAAPEDISGDRPMNINWTFAVPLPAGLFSEFSVLRGQG